MANTVRVAVTGGTSGLGLALVRRLTAAGAHTAFIARTGEAVARIAKETVTLRVEAPTPVRLEAQVEPGDSQPRTITVPQASYAELVGRQLSDRERDPVFRESMAVARALAESLLNY